MNLEHLIYDQLALSNIYIPAVTMLLAFLYSKYSNQFLTYENIENLLHSSFNAFMVSPPGITTSLMIITLPIMISTLPKVAPLFGIAPQVEDII